MFNRIILIGRLTRDPEIRYTPAGVAVATVPIAVNSRYRQGEDFREETLFIDAVVFGKQAETCTQYLNKGRMVLVEGRLRERRWEHEGQKRSKVEVIANNIRFLSKKESADSPEMDQIPPEEYTDLEPF
ncbi:single-stranded DNA-binding protein [Thermodesulfovibrio hydrogeniphilus]